MKLRFVERTWLLKMKQEEKKVSKGYDNELQMEFDAISYNEGFARMAVSAFIAPLNPTMEEMADVKTAVSEAVTNAIIHGYGNVQGYMPGRMQCPRETNCGKVRMYCRITGDVLFVEIEDDGRGIENVEQALEPLFTTMYRKQKSRSIRQGRNWSVPVWDLLLWKLSWMICRYSQRQAGDVRS